MAHGIEVRMPFLDWHLVTYSMALPEESKYADGVSKLVARRAMEGRMPESIRNGKLKIGFASPMPDWLNGPLLDWTNKLIAKRVPAFAELVDETVFKKSARAQSAKMWDWASADLVWPYLHLK